MDVVLRRALDRCDCRRCRSLAQQLDALVPTPSHIAAYVAMGSAIALTAVLAAARLGWSWPRLLGLALLAGIVWFLCLMGAMAWAGARFLSPDPLAWSLPGRWFGWTWVVVALFVVLFAIQVLTGGPLWLVGILVGGSGVQAWFGRRTRQRQRAECWRDRTG